MSNKILYKIFESEQCRIITDSRLVTHGDIFFALKGECFDGNRFAGEALRKGARLVVVDDPEIHGERVVNVEDVLAELQSMASLYRDTFNIPVLAITGSNGKTTTKELLASVLSEKYTIHYTQGNLNNHIGVPLTILSAGRETQFLLIEMGANHPGEIKMLCEIAKPGYGLVTNIGRAHLEGFGSPEAVAEAKSELYRYIDEQKGVVFYNGDNKQLSLIIDKLGVKAFPYLNPGRSKVLVKALSPGLALALSLEIDGKPYQVETALFGNHNIENVLAAVACGLYFNIEPENIVRAINRYRPVNNRSQVLVTPLNRIVCDSYNANPSSMEEALASFIGQEGASKAIILGDMLELGKYSDEEHLRIVNRLGQVTGVDIYLVGPIFMKVARESGFRLFKDVDDLNNYLSGNPIKNTFVLVKGSRGINLEKVYPFL